MSSRVVTLLMSCSVELEAGRLSRKQILFISIFCEVDLVVLNFLESLGESVGLHSKCSIVIVDGYDYIALTRANDQNRNNLEVCFKTLSWEPDLSGR